MKERGDRLPAAGALRGHPHAEEQRLRHGRSAALAFVLGFAAIWYIWWLVDRLRRSPSRSRVIIRASSDDTDYVLTGGRSRGDREPALRRDGQGAAARRRRCAGRDAGRAGAGDGCRDRRDAAIAGGRGSRIRRRADRGEGVRLLDLPDDRRGHLRAAVRHLCRLSRGTAGGPTGKDLFSLPHTFGETMLLLVSSTTFGFATPRRAAPASGARCCSGLLVTALLGLGFVGMEIQEFAGMIAKGAGPDRSGFLSAFFTLVGTHGVHVSVGLISILVMIGQIARQGPDGAGRRRGSSASACSGTSSTSSGSASSRSSTSRGFFDMQHAASTPGPDLPVVSDRPGAGADPDRDPLRAGLFQAAVAGPTVAVIAIAAIVQVVVHLRYLPPHRFQADAAGEPAGAVLRRLPDLHHGRRQLWIMFDLHYRMVM